MDDLILNGLFCLLGIVVTIIVGKWGVKKKVITNYCTNKFSIGKKLRDEFEKLEISYDNKTITNELKVYKGIIINTGNEDIDNIPESGIVMKCPDNWVIKDRIIGSHSKNIKITCEKGKDDTETRFTPDMLKIGEGFSYSILYEIVENDNKDDSNPKKKSGNNIEFFDRIKDTKIKKEYIPISKGLSRKYITMFYFVTVCIMLVFMGFFYMAPSGLAVEVTDNKTGETKFAGFNKDGNYVIADNEFALLWSSRIINKQEFQEHYSITIIKNKESTMIFIMCLIYLISLLGLWYISYDKQKKIKMLRSFESNSISNNNGNV